MSQIPANADYAALEQRLRTLHADLDANLRHLRARRNVTLVVLLLLVVAEGAYLWWLHHKLAAIDAPTVVSYTEMQLQDQIEGSPERVAELLREQAPAAIDRAEALARRAPASLAGYARNAAVERVRSELPKFEEQLYGAVSGLIDRAAADAADQGLNVDDPQQLEDLSARLAASVARDSRQVIDRVYADYRGFADQFIAYMDHLADGRGLDPRERLHRDLTISTLAVLQKALQESPANPAAPAATPDPLAPRLRQMIDQKLQAPATAPAPAAASGAPAAAE